MANGTEERNRHFVLEGVTEVEPYRSRRKAAAGPTSRHATAKGTAQVARDLKNTCKGNLFVIFGEPDIDELVARQRAPGTPLQNPVQKSH